jgi:phosphatidylglycerophosphate synthase
MTALGLSPPVTLINVPNAITAVRTAGSVGLAVAALTHRSAHLLVAAYLVYWIGDILDGAAARALGQETRTGAVFDIVADRACTSACAAAPKPPGRLATILTRPKAAGARLVEVMERPRHATGVLLVSAVTGFPPLLAVSVYLGRTPMRPAVFAATCLLGRTIRFVTIALAPRFAGY